MQQLSSPFGVCPSGKKCAMFLERAETSSALLVFSDNPEEEQRSEVIQDQDGLGRKERSQTGRWTKV